MTKENHKRMETPHQVERQIQDMDQSCRYEGGASSGNCRVCKGKGNLK